MLSCKNLRWAGHGISNGRLRLSKPTTNARSYSIYSSQNLTTRTLRSPRYNIPTNTQQSRSISLFGWKSAPQPPATNAINASTETTPDIEIGSNTLPESLNNIRTVKASYNTSDAPDPQSPQYLPSNTEPEFVEKFQEAVTFPPNSDTFNELVEDSTAIAAEPERIGYLKEVCGLDFGWGPTAIMEWSLEHLHITGGLGWAASIAVLATLLRLSMVSPMITAQREAAKLREFTPILKPLQEKQAAFMKAGNRQKAMEVAQEMRYIRKEANISYTRAFVPMLIQFPFQFGAFRLLQNAGALPVPGFLDEGYLWISDLTLADPFFISPAISSMLIYLQFKQSQQASAASMTTSPIAPNMMKIIGTALPAASFVFMIWQPAAVQLYFMISSVFAYTTAGLLRQGFIRKTVGLPPNVPGSEPKLPKFLKSPTDTTTTAAATAATATPTAPVGGLRTSLKSIKPVEEPVEPPKSFIDQTIDKVKGAFKPSINTTKEKVKAKADEKAKAKYEGSRRRQLAITREERNARP